MLRSTVRIRTAASVLTGPMKKPGHTPTATSHPSDHSSRSGVRLSKGGTSEHVDLDMWLHQLLYEWSSRLAGVPV